MARAERPVHERPDFRVHVDEFQSFGTDALLESGDDPQAAQEARAHYFADTLERYFTTYFDNVR